MRARAAPPHRGRAVIDLGAVLARVDRALEACALEAPGHYRRWTRPGADRDLAANPYGCADAVNLLFTLGRLPESGPRRDAHVDALRAFQDATSGMFREATHHEIHVTAHCAAALELLGARPAHPLHALAHLDAPRAIDRFLDALPWRDDPWLASHRGAGVYAARLLAGEASDTWQARYFAWLDAACDPGTGLWRAGCVTAPFRWGASRFPHLAGTFHYLFNYEHAGRPHPHAERLVDTCLDLWRAGDEWPLGRTVSFAEVDWVYCLSRASGQSGHRRDEALEALRTFAADYVDFLSGLDWDAEDGACDLHRVFGATCALAELQQVLAGDVSAEPGLRLVLDRRPFI